MLEFLKNLWATILAFINKVCGYVACSFYCDLKYCAVYAGSASSCVAGGLS